MRLIFLLRDEDECAGGLLGQPRGPFVNSRKWLFPNSIFRVDNPRAEESAMWRRFSGVALVLGLMVVATGGRAYGQDQAPAGWSQEDMARIAPLVEKKIVSLPNYGVFDDIHFGIKGKTVILYGYASRPTLKSDAERAVKGIKGVESVDNQIEVLPNSPNDDRIRAAVYAAIYQSNSPLQKYSGSRGIGDRNSITRRAGGITYDPPLGYHAIHIIVKNGNVTLRGVVLNDMDSAIANIRVNQVPGVFSVSNDLVVQGRTASAKKG